MTIRKLFLGVVASTVMATSAIAADLPPAPAITAPPPPPAMAAPAFDWGGFFVGIEGGYNFCSVCLNWWQVGLQLGYNRVAGSLLYGINAEFGTVVGALGTEPYGELSARLGYIVGRTLLFVDAGVGAFFAGPPVFYYQADIGAEVALGGAVSLSASFGTQKVPIGPWVWTANIGLNWRPGR